MGSRAQVYMKDTGVYLYTHWDSGRLKGIVQKAIARMERWDDEEYLTRIIFSEMIKDNIEGATGYGIGCSKHGDIELVITVKCDSDGYVIVKDMYTNEREIYSSLNEFIKGSCYIERPNGDSIPGDEETFNDGIGW